MVKEIIIYLDHPSLIRTNNIKQVKISNNYVKKYEKTNYIRYLLGAYINKCEDNLEPYILNKHINFGKKENEICYVDIYIINNTLLDLLINKYPSEHLIIKELIKLGLEPTNYPNNVDDWSKELIIKYWID